jgi:hypothetical protein
METDSMQTPLVPKGLSPRSRAIWRDLVTEHQFEANELVSFRRALEWFDRSDALIASADGMADARERAALTKQAMDASDCGLRYWRVLKFVDPVMKRRPGRPSDDGWSIQRREQAASRPKAV